MVHIIDTFQLQRTKIIAVTLLETNDGLACFDCGPESTFENVVAGMKAAGVSPRDVRHLFLSHIHFDHAGAAWRLAELGATVYVHPRGAPHMISPAKLIESATRIYGDDMPRLWGKLAPVAEDKVRIANDGDIFTVGQFEVRAIDTPGRANHHNVYQWGENLFGGDVAGVTINGGPAIPPFVPPELHIESWQQSLEKIRVLKPARIYLPHYGLVEGNVDEHLDAVEERLHRWSNWFRDQLRAGKTETDLIPLFAKYEADDLMAGGVGEEVVKDYEYADPSFMAVSSSIRYWNKFHPDALK